MILAIDPGRTTGFAWSDRTVGTYRATVGDDGESICRWWQWLADLCCTRPVSLMIVERPFLRGVADADFTLTLARSAHAIAWQRDIPRVEYAAVEWRPIVFGKGVYGKVPKNQRDRFRVREAIDMGWQVSSDHEADASLMLHAHEILNRGVAA